MGDLERKIESRFRSKLEEEPGNLTARLEFVRFLLARGRKEEAEFHMSEALKLDPEHEDVVQTVVRYLLSDEENSIILLGGRRGFLHMTGKDYAFLAEFVKQALEKNPRSAGLYSLLGDLKMQEEKPRRAFRYYLRAAKLSDDPQIKESLIHCLSRLVEEKHIEEKTAVDAVMKMLARDPDNPSLLEAVSDFMYGLERWEDAIRYALRAFQLEPTRTGLYEYVALLDERFYPEEAARVLKENERLFEGDPEGYLMLGREYELLDRLDEAAEAYRKALKLSPRNSDALLRLARVLRRKRQPPDEVEEYYKQAMESDPDDVDACLDYCDYLLARGRREEALPLYRRVIDHERVETRDFVSFLQLLLELGNKEEALEYLRGFDKRLDEYFPELDEHAAAARLLILAGEEEAGERLLKRITEHPNAESFFAYEYLGDFYYEKGRLSEAFAEYLLALLMDPSDTTMWLKTVGTIFEAREDPKALAEMSKFAGWGVRERSKRKFSIELLRVVYDLIPLIREGNLEGFTTLREAAWQLGHPSLLAAYGKITAELGGDEEAREAFAKAFEAAPGDTALVREYVGFLFARGDYAAAIPILRKGMEESPDEHSLENDYALALYETGERERAEEIFERLAKRHPLEPTYVYNHAWLLFEKGALEEAEKVLAEYHEKGPFDAENALFYAQVLAEGKDRSKFAVAEECLRKVLGARPDHAPALLLLAWVEGELGRFSSAEFYLKKARKAVPDDPRVPLTAAGFFTSTMQFRKAARMIGTASAMLEGSSDEAMKTELLLRKAHFLQATGDHERSLPFLKRLFVASPEEYGFHLACTLMHLGNEEEARKVASGLLERPASRRDCLARSWYLFLTGATKEAFEDLMDGMSGRTEVTDFRNLAIYLLELGALEDAQQAMGIFLENVVQPLDVHFLIRDLEDHAARFPEQGRKRFLLQASLRLQALLRKIYRRGRS